MAKTRNAEVLALDTSKQKEVAKQTKQLKKSIKDGTIAVKEVKKARRLTVEQSRGLLFISHLPHGFYEDELKKYFQQFGKVTNVKVCRSRKSGRSKGFGYVEFSHPEVAKIAADTMNNYLMFKKRIVAEFVPYEKRPKGVFIGKSATLERFSSKVRRQKQHQANLKLDENTHLKRTSSRLLRLNKHLQKLNKLGVETTYTPENLAVIKQEDKEQPSLIQIYPVETTVSLKKSSKSVKSVKSLPESNVKSLPNKKLNGVSKSKSLTTVKSSNKSVKGDNSVSMKDVSTSSPLTKRPKKKSKLTNAGVTKRSKKPAPLNSETVKKIARELIRKKGDTLLVYPVSVKDKSKKKLGKK